MPFEPLFLQPPGGSCRRPELGGDFGRAGAQRRKSGALARRWSRRESKHLQPRLAAKSSLESVSRQGSGRVALDS